jgi:hypothetical protein
MEGKDIMWPLVIVAVGIALLVLIELKETEIEHWLRKWRNTLDFIELKHSAIRAIKFHADNKLEGPPTLTVIVPRDSSGKRCRVVPGLTGQVRATEYGPDGKPRTIVVVNAQEALRFAEAQLKGCL